MSSITGIHHINFLVRDLDKSADFMQRLLGTSPCYESLTARSVKTARFDLGQSFIVLVCPIDGDSMLARMLNERGEGIFLMSLATQSLDDAIIRLENEGISMSPSGERQGLDKWRVNDIDVPNAFAPFLQLCEDPRKP